MLKGTLSVTTLEKKSINNLFFFFFPLKDYDSQLVLRFKLLTFQQVSLTFKGEMLLEYHLPGVIALHPDSFSVTFRDVSCHPQQWSSFMMLASSKNKAMYIPTTCIMVMSLAFFCAEMQQFVRALW